MLCPPGSFCASGAAAAGDRRLLQQHEQQQECPAGQMSGAGAVACVADCGAGMFSPDGSAAGCRMTSGPLLLRQAWFFQVPAAPL